jgi:tellurite resistance protein TehA-like permease
MAISEISRVSTPEDFLGYSPHTFLLGALSFQVIALPFYNFGLNGVGNIISDAGGFIFLILALIAAFKWRAIKKKLSETERENLYQPSVWIYIFGFLLTNLLYAEFTQKFGAPTAVLFWLNGFFLIAILGRFFRLFKRKKKIVQIQDEI